MEATTSPIHEATTRCLAGFNTLTNTVDGGKDHGDKHARSQPLAGSYPGSSGKSDSKSLQPTLKPNQTIEIGVITKPDKTRSTINDNHARFRIWAGNLGAYQRLPSRSSADFRLREAPEVADRILEILEDIVESNQDIIDCLQTPKKKYEGVEDTDGDVNILEDLCLTVGDSLTSLLKVSALIRKATTRDRYALAVASKNDVLPEQYAAFDKNHVLEKFPKTASTEWLYERLASAITQRRRYLRYAQGHQNRVANDKAVQHAAEKQNTPAPAPARKEQDRVSVGNTLTRTLASTKASTLFKAKVAETNLENPDVDDDDNISHATSFISTASGKGDPGRAQVVKLEDLTKDYEPFECPYCRGIVQCKNQRSWRKHVFRDLRAYVCTHEKCDVGLFEDKQAWFNHELEQHLRVWICLACPSKTFDTEAAFRKHLELSHKYTDHEVIESVASSASRPVVEISVTSCPFCDEWADQLKVEPKDVDSTTVSTSLFRQHLGSHHEQLALFAITPDFERELDSEHGSQVSNMPEADRDQVLERWRSRVSDGDISEAERDVESEDLQFSENDEDDSDHSEAHLDIADKTSPATRKSNQLTAENLSTHRVATLSTPIDDEKSPFQAPAAVTRGIKGTLRATFKLSSFEKGPSLQSVYSAAKEASYVLHTSILQVSILEMDPVWIWTLVLRLDLSVHPRSDIVMTINGDIDKFAGGQIGFSLSRKPFTERNIISEADLADILTEAVRERIDFFFHGDNLRQDMDLRKHMDSQGFILIYVIKGLTSIAQLTDDQHTLIKACNDSDVVDAILGDDSIWRIRRLEGWEEFVLPIEQRFESARSEGPSKTDKDQEAQHDHKGMTWDFWDPAAPPRRFQHILDDDVYFVLQPGGQSAAYFRSSGSLRYVPSDIEHRIFACEQDDSRFYAYNTGEAEWFDRFGRMMKFLPGQLPWLGLPLRVPSQYDDRGRSSSNTSVTAAADSHLQDGGNESDRATSYPRRLGLTAIQEALLRTFLRVGRSLLVLEENLRSGHSSSNARLNLEKQMERQNMVYKDSWEACKKAGIDVHEALREDAIQPLFPTTRVACTWPTCEQTFDSREDMFDHCDIEHGVVENIGVHEDPESARTEAMHNDRLTRVPDDNILVHDAGGGTVDIVTLKKTTGAVGIDPLEMERLKALIRNMKSAMDLANVSDFPARFSREARTHQTAIYHILSKKTANDDRHAVIEVLDRALEQLDVERPLTDNRGSKLWRDWGEEHIKREWLSEQTPDGAPDETAGDASQRWAPVSKPSALRPESSRAAVKGDIDFPGPGSVLSASDQLEEQSSTKSQWALQRTPSEIVRLVDADTRWVEATRNEVVEEHDDAQEIRRSILWKELRYSMYASLNPSPDFSKARGQEADETIWRTLREEKKAMEGSHYSAKVFLQVAMDDVIPPDGFDDEDPAVKNWKIAMINLWDEQETNPRGLDLAEDAPHESDFAGSAVAQNGEHTTSETQPGLQRRPNDPDAERLIATDADTRRIEAQKARQRNLEADELYDEPEEVRRSVLDSELREAMYADLTPSARFPDSTEARERALQILWEEREATDGSHVAALVFLRSVLDDVIPPHPFGDEDEAVRRWKQDIESYWMAQDPTQGLSAATEGVEGSESSDDDDSVNGKDQLGDIFRMAAGSAASAMGPAQSGYESVEEEDESEEADQEHTEDTQVAARMDEGKEIERDQGGSVTQYHCAAIGCKGVFTDLDQLRIHSKESKHHRATIYESSTVKLRHQRGRTKQDMDTQDRGVDQDAPTSFTEYFCQHDYCHRIFKDLNQVGEHLEKTRHHRYNLYEHRSGIGFLASGETSPWNDRVTLGQGQLCGWPDCGQMVSGGESEMAEHLDSLHQGRYFDGERSEGPSNEQEAAVADEEDKKEEELGTYFNCFGFGCGEENISDHRKLWDHYRDTRHDRYTAYERSKKKVQGKERGKEEIVTRTIGEARLCEWPECEQIVWGGVMQMGDHLWNFHQV